MDVHREEARSALLYVRSFLTFWISSQRVVGNAAGGRSRACPQSTLNIRTCIYTKSNNARPADSARSTRRASRPMQTSGSLAIHDKIHDMRCLSVFNDVPCPMDKSTMRRLRYFANNSKTAHLSNIKCTVYLVPSRRYQECGIILLCTCSAPRLALCTHIDHTLFSVDSSPI